MKNSNIISCVTFIMGIFMISIGLVVQNQESMGTVSNNLKVQEFKIQNMSASTNMIVKDTNTKEKQTGKELLLTEVVMETAPASIIVPPRVEVYEGMTLEEVAAKLDRSLGSDLTAGKGMLIATECINKGMDPFVGASIILHETGCGVSCSSLARYCYNFGGQKGGPSCNGGAYKRYNSVDEGIVGVLDNLYKNYYAMGLNTVETIGPKYAEGNTWVSKINWYVNKLKQA